MDDHLLDVLVVGAVGRLARGRLALAPELVARVVVERLRAAGVPVRRLGGVVLAGLFPPRAALGLPELPDQLVERLRRATRALPAEPPVHLPLQLADRVEVAVGGVRRAALHRDLPRLRFGFVVLAVVVG